MVWCVSSFHCQACSNWIPSIVWQNGKHRKRRDHVFCYEKGQKHFIKFSLPTMLWKALSYEHKQEVRQTQNILVKKSNLTFTIYTFQSSYSYKIPSSVITGLKDIHFSLNVFWRDKRTFFYKSISGGPREMMVLFSRTSLISLPTVLFWCTIFNLEQ